MRAALAIAMATLTLGLASRPMHGQTRAADTLLIEEIHMVDQQTGWVVTHDMRFARTTDSGVSWKDVTPYYPGDGSVLHVPMAFVFTANFAWFNGLRTVDGGQTWRRPVTRWTGGLAWIDFTNTTDGWALTYDAVHAPKHMPKPVPVVFRSTDAGDTWNRAVEQGNLGTIARSLTFVSGTTGWFTSGVPNSNSYWLPLFITRDGGRTWTDQSLPRPPGVPSVKTGTTSPVNSWASFCGPVRFFTPRDAIFPISYAYVDLQTNARASFAIVYVTHDAGTTWTYTAPVSVANQCLACIGPQAPIVVINFADINHGWIADGDTLYATINSGRQWTTIRPASFPGAKQLNFISAQVGWAVAREAPFLLKTLDGGRTWSPVTYTILR
jgi:photosystem II stability/assembly factor-like uncharacterized protein